jgi:hypothetical protein
VKGTMGDGDEQRRRDGVPCAGCLALEKREAPSNETIWREIVRIRAEREDCATRTDLLVWAERSRVEATRVRLLAMSRRSASPDSK